MTKIFKVIACLCILEFFERSAQACAVCFGDPSSPLTRGIALGVWVLMGFIGCVLIAFAILFLNIRQRMKKNTLANVITV